MQWLLTELAVFTKVTANAKPVISTATAMTILGAAMLVFGEAVEKMGNLSWGEIGRGLTTMAGFFGGCNSCDESSSEGNDVESDWNGGSWCGITHHR